MRGSDHREQSLFSYVSIEDRIPKRHPLRLIKRMVDRALREMSPAFEQMYSRMGRPSIPPEQLLRACLLQLFYSVRSERLLMEQIDYNLLFRWFVGLGMDDPVWVATTFTKNRDRLLKGDVAKLFLAAVLRQAAEHKLLSEEHFTVDGTLVEAWASHKSFRPKDDPGPPDAPAGRNPEVDFRGEKRSNQTHQSTTDPDARLAKKGSAAAKLCYTASALMENRNGLIVDTEVEHATGTAERDSALAMLERQPEAEEPRTLGADKHYDTKDFVQGCNERKFVPHVAPNTANGRTSSVDPQVVATAGYPVSQCKRKLVEQTFGWDKTVGLLRKLRHRGKPLVGWIFTFTSTAYNLIRMRTLLQGAVCP
jgi:transposase